MHRYALVTGTDPSLLLHLRTVLGQMNYRVESLPPHRPPTHSFHLAVVDARTQPGRERLRSLAGRGMILAICSPDLERTVLNHGADEVLFSTQPEPQDIVDALTRIERALRRPVDGLLGSIIGRSQRLTLVLNRIHSFAAAPSTVLITGETGTGKEMIAHGMHQASQRCQGPFVAVNCAAIPESLVESELFGHRRGAFTGATTQNPGRLASAEGGTLFLDEVGELPLGIQAKLLRVLQEREYNPVGDTIARKANVRIIAATNRDLQGEVKHGRFRPDLYWRLEVITVELPPLRERQGDVLPLAFHFIDRTNQIHDRNVNGIAEGAQRLLLSHDWPGNVRELENTVERAVILRGSGQITEEDIILRRVPVGHVLGNVRLPADGLDLMEVTWALEVLLVNQALERTGGNKSRAARLLGINRTTLVEKLRRRVGGIEERALLPPQEPPDHREARDEEDEDVPLPLGRAGRVHGGRR